LPFTVVRRVLTSGYSDIRMSECVEKGGKAKEEEVVPVRRPTTKVVFRGGAEPQRRLVLEA
jgi:hypothetical protein